MKTDDQLSQASESPAKVPQSVDSVEVATSGSALNAVLWLLAIVLLIGATLVNQYLPAYWHPATHIGVRIAVIVGMIVTACAAIYLTRQGKGFLTLLKDARLELRRITWPNKQDTFKTTWIVLVVVLVMSLILWGIDTLFGWLISSIIG